MEINFQDSPKPIVKPYSWAQRVNPRLFEIETLINRLAIKTVKICPDLSPSYHWMNDTIEIHDISYYKSSWAYYHTALHEISHATGNRNRLNRGVPQFQIDYDKEEVIAEIATLKLCKAFGFADKVSDHCVNYIRHYARPDWMDVCSKKADKAVKYLASL